MDEQFKLFASLHNNDLRKESDDITIIPSFDIIEKKSQFIINIISNIDLKSDDEIKNFIQKYHISFLNYCLFTESDVSRNAMQKLFTNTRFLNLFFNIIGNLKLDNIELIFLNRIAYDYWSLKEKDNDICNILLQISAYINNNLIIKLSSKMGINEARILAMISHSTDIQEIKVHRINRFLINCMNPVLDIQSMIDIMFFIYDRFLYPIIYTLVEDESSCNNTECIGQYRNLQNAIVTILLSMPSEKITQVLTEYGYLLSNNKIVPHIKLKQINDARLQEIICIVEQNPLIKNII